MAGTFPSVLPSPAKDGVAYCSAVNIPALEGDLATPLPVLYNEAFLAVVELSVVGVIASQTTFIVAQTDVGDGVWADVAWATWTGTTGTANFFLSGGVAGANSFQQRVAGSAPTPVNGSNQMPLGGRVRFVGKASITGSSSSSSASPGVTPNIQATVRIKQLGLR